MAYSVELFFTSAAEEAVRNIWAQLDSAALPSLTKRSHRNHRPHIALAVSDRLPLDDSILSSLSGALSEREAEMQLGPVAAFPGSGGVLVLSAIVTPRLLELHQKVYDILKSYKIEVWPYYEPRNWFRIVRSPKE